MVRISESSNYRGYELTDIDCIYNDLPDGGKENNFVVLELFLARIHDFLQHAQKMTSEFGMLKRRKNYFVLLFRI